MVWLLAGEGKAVGVVGSARLWSCRNVDAEAAERFIAGGDVTVDAGCEEEIGWSSRPCVLRTAKGLVTEAFRLCWSVQVMRERLTQTA